jgi:SAM-dependent methyltransferase
MGAVLPESYVPWRGTRLGVLTDQIEFMKLRQSGMPGEAYWESLFDIPLILDRLGVNARLHDVVELGCGYGTFTIPVAKCIAGTIESFDIDPEMVERTRQRAATAGVSNVVLHQRDVFVEGFGGPPQSRDACLLFNILHCEEPVRLLAEAASTLHPGGWVLVIHWRYDSATPRGPSMDIRPRPEHIAAWAKEAEGLTLEGSSIDLPPWHYGMRLRKKRHHP